VLFELESDPKDEDAVLRWHAGEAGADEETLRFAGELVRGVRENRERLDDAIAGASRNWRLDQMAKVDRIILQIATYEIAVSREVPVKAAINESIELAKTFSGEEAGRFVNGVLGKIAAGAAS
jgi:N utilization substance protein B